MLLFFYYWSIYQRPSLPHWPLQPQETSSTKENQQCKYNSQSSETDGCLLLVKFIQSILVAFFNQTGPILMVRKSTPYMEWPSHEWLKGAHPTALLPTLYMGMIQEKPLSPTFLLNPFYSHQSSSSTNYLIFLLCPSTRCHTALFNITILYYIVRSAIYDASSAFALVWNYSLPESPPSSPPPSPISTLNIKQTNIKQCFISSSHNLITCMYMSVKLLNIYETRNLQSLPQN